MESINEEATIVSSQSSPEYTNTTPSYQPRNYYPVVGDDIPNAWSSSSLTNNDTNEVDVPQIKVPKQEFLVPTTLNGNYEKKCAKTKDKPEPIGIFFFGFISHFFS